MNQTYDLSRFEKAHRKNYARALREIKNGRKTTHWMWYIFPQIKGLGFSSTAQFYSIQSLDEAIAFLNDPYLGGNLKEISSALLELPTNNATQVFGFPDDLKLKSSMTLFKYASNGPSVFDKVLDKYYGGTIDVQTKNILGL